MLRCLEVGRGEALILGEGWKEIAIAQLGAVTLPSLFASHPPLGKGPAEVVKSFPVSALPRDPAQRFAALFAERPKWEAAELEPYIADIKVRVLGIWDQGLPVHVGGHSPPANGSSSPVPCTSLSSPSPCRCLASAPARCCSSTPACHSRAPMTLSATQHDEPSTSWLEK